MHMKKLLMFAAFAVVLCSCGSGGSNQENNKTKFDEEKTKFDEEIVKEDRKEYTDYIRKARQYEDNGNLDAAIKQYEYALEIESTYSDTEYSEWFNSDVAVALKRVEDRLREAKSVSLTGTHKNHEWVDLGLSVKWATCNVGTSNPGDYGNHYAWGETTTKSTYTEDNSDSYESSDSKWNNIGGNSRYDAATANWGDGWRMPTEAEFQELMDNCTWEWTTQNGHKGYKVTSKKNCQSIFLPAAGYRYGAKEVLVGSTGEYWSSTPYESDADGAFKLCFYKDDHSVYWCNRFAGSSVRPVLE